MAQSQKYEKQKWKNGKQSKRHTKIKCQNEQSLLIWWIFNIYVSNGWPICSAYFAWLFAQLENSLSALFLCRSRIGIWVHDIRAHDKWINNEFKKKTNQNLSRKSLFHFRHFSSHPSDEDIRSKYQFQVETDTHCLPRTNSKISSHTANKTHSFFKSEIKFEGKKTTSFIDWLF